MTPARAGRYHLMFEAPVPPVRCPTASRYPNRGVPRGRCWSRWTSRDGRGHRADRRAWRGQRGHLTAPLLRQSGARAARTEIFQHELPDVCGRLSDIWPELREYERAVATVVSAYVGPDLLHLLHRLEERPTPGIPARCRSWRRPAASCRPMPRAERCSASSRARPPGSLRPAPRPVLRGSTSSPSTWGAPRPRPRDAGRASRHHAPVPGGGGQLVASGAGAGSGRCPPSISPRSAPAGAASPGSTGAVRCTSDR